jgi:N utilization substance protein B
MSPVDRNVIRLAVVELEAGTVPPRVVMDEAIEISREYGSLESPRFVNGVLDALYKQQSAAGGEDTA